MDYFLGLPGIVWAVALFVVSAARIYASFKSGLVKGETGDWKRKKDPEWFWAEALADLTIASLSGAYIVAELPDYL